MKVFINTNKFQKLAALVSKFSFNRFGVNEVEILEFENTPILTKNLNKPYLRNGIKKKFRDDLQSFTLLRLIAPQKSNYSGSVLTIDPDIFALKDPKDEFKKIEAENENIFSPSVNNIIRSEVIFLKSDKVKWDFEDLIEKLFNLKIDYKELINLKFENQNIGILEQKFNQLDNFDQNTILLHTTNRITQPWKYNLNIDFEKHVKKSTIFKNYIKKIFNFNYDKNLISNKYLMHPDKKVFDLVCKLFYDAYREGVISNDQIRKAIDDKAISSDFCRIAKII